ncbi:MAG: hypothetical protein HGA45_32310 [Chloroflexales bacterium]|nr:hypothetical protein [Chloroflexales bacterium]
MYEEGQGRWRAALVIDGKVVRRRAHSEREAKAILKALRQQRDEGLNVGDGQQTLSQWLEHWLTTILPGKDIKAKTLDGHRYIVEHYITPYLGKHRLANLSAQHIDQWQSRLRQEGLSTGTITNARRRLSTALEIARKRKLVTDQRGEPNRGSTRACEAARGRGLRAHRTAGQAVPGIAM